MPAKKTTATKKKTTATKKKTTARKKATAARKKTTAARKKITATTKKATVRKKATATTKRSTRARKGDLIVLDSPQVGSPTREGEVLRVIQGDVSVSYRVRWADGHETLISPAAGAMTIVRT